METRAVALTIVFSALAVALNPIRIPTVYWPMWSYYVYEIPIVVAFLLLGPRIGIAVAGLHLLGQEVFFSNGLGGLLAYPIGTVAILVTLLGTHLATMYIKHKKRTGKPLTGKNPVLVMTAVTCAVRGGIMPFIDYWVLFRTLFRLFLDPTLFTDAFINNLIPAFIVFNLTVPLYTIPISYVIAKKVGRNLKIETNL